jgi:hypothetical protein
MAFPNDQYAPPGVYTRTLFENPLAQALASLKIPVFIGEGSESLFQRDLEVVRGSSQSVDTRVPQEDMTGRAVVAVLASGQVTVGSFDGVRTKFQVRNFPIVTGDGTGTATTNRSDVQVVTENNEPLVVISVDGVNGIVELAQPPASDQEVRCSYFFDRTDTLATDDVSAQVTSETATVQAISGIIDVNSPNQTGPQTPLVFHADILNVQGEVVVPANNVLLVTVDGVSQTVVIPPSTSGYSIAQVASAITGNAAGTLVGGTFVNQFGHSALSLSADSDILIGDGSANALLGLVTGQSSNRALTFYTFNGPITDGSDGGVTTTDPAHVTVKVDGSQVIPTSVDGASRAVTLPSAPIPGATVTIQYWWNTWQDTFDYLANINVTEILQTGFTPGGSDFIQAADFVLQDDKIHWGTAAAVRAGTNTAGTEFFDDTQITPVLIDNRTYLSLASAVIDAASGTASAMDFQLPLQPTLGNGRSTEIGQSLFQDVSNGRIDLPVNRPDVIDAYWGYDVQDALARGKVDIAKVEGLVITLTGPVPVGANVYATFYYNRLTDDEFTLTNTLAGASGTGQYTAQDTAGNDVFNADFDLGTKGTALSGVTVEFPSGSELTPDFRHEGVSGTQFIGPVEEVVTVEFATRWEGPARYTSPGSSEYEFILNQSDRLRMEIDASPLTDGNTGLDLSASGYSGGPVTYGVFASLLGDEIEYTGGTGTVGLDYDLLANEGLSLLIDNSEVEVQVEAQTGATAATFISRINEAAGGHTAPVAAGGAANTSEIELAAAVRSGIPDYYKNWVVVIGNGAGGATAGDVATVTAYNGTTGIASLSPALSGIPNGDPYHIYNPASRSFLKGATRFSGPVDITASGHDDLVFQYTGDVAGASGALTAILTPGTYATATDLAAEVNTQLAAQVGTLGAAFAGLEIGCTADGDGRLQFAIQLPGTDSAGSLEFLDAATDGDDFAITAGLGTAAASGGGQPALIQAPVASLYTVSTGGITPYDRIILRNRIMPGGGAGAPSSMASDFFESQTGLLVRGGSGQDKTGLRQGETGEATAAAVVRPASLTGFPSLNGGFVASGELQVLFYDGTGIQPANNVLQFTMDGVPVTVTFTASATGTATDLGPVSGASNGSVLDQIVDAMAAVAGAPFGTAAAIFAAELVRQEGLGVRLTSALSSVQSVISIGDESANATLGLTEGTVAQRMLVTARMLASYLMGQRNTSFATALQDPTAATAGHFAAEALAGVEVDAALAEFLYVQSRTVGAGSQVRVRFTSVAGVQTTDALFTGTGLNIQDNDGALGEGALNGFFVTSGTANGSGSANDSVLNNGVGSDGIIGQTYRDPVTGLTFTILPRGWHTNPVGPWVAYPTGSAASFRVNVSKTMTTDANLPVRAFPGLELRVSNTLNVGQDDTAILNTYERAGEEPAVGDLYYVSYVFQKQDFGTQFFTKMSAIETAYGSISPDNPVTLASYLAILNGAVLLGIKQVEKAEGSEQASLDSYKAAIEDLEGVQPGQVAPDMITPLRGDSLELFQILKKSNDIMSSIRYRSERTSIIGLSAGTLPNRARDVAQSLRNTRMRLVYPDIATLDITDAFGVTKEYLVDGTYMAAALTGSVVSPNFDVATPWTNRLLVGFNSLARVLDAVEMNQTAVAGVTLLEQRGVTLRVRHELTTDMTNQLTKLPTIVLIADEVQRQARSTLDRFIGLKYLPTVVAQVEGRLSMMFKNLVSAQIVAAYTGIKATPDELDQTLLNVEAFYSPIFPLLYIVITFHLRSRLTT